MKLASYLADHHLTHAKFGMLVGATQAAVTRYANGQRMPNLRTMVRIEQVTEGAVTARDFVADRPSAAVTGAAA